VISVLVVDDEAAMRSLMTRWVQMAGHSASAASSAEEALDVMAERSPAIALCDIRMPGHDGLWLAGRIRRDFPDTAVIMATAARDTDPRVAEHSGAVDYLVKPFGRDRLKFALERGLDWHCAASTRREWVGRLTGDMSERRASLAASLDSLRGTGSCLDALMMLINDSDPALLAHSCRVAAMAVRVGEALGLDAAALQTLHDAGLLHDFGKLALPEAILMKPAALSLEEKEIVRRHPEIAVEMLRTLNGFEGAAAIVQSSNERFDGSGYPQAIDGESISLESRIIAVTDAFDAMTRTRIYRDAMPSSEATQEILRCSSTQFDPIVASTLLEILGELKSTTH
jgi:putative two-component system response regulator